MVNADIFSKPKVSVNLRKLFLHESNMQADAYNKEGGGFGARGLGQIRKPVLDDWNSTHPKQQYKPDDMFHLEPNVNVADWYVNQTGPKTIAAQFKQYGVQDTEENRVAAYKVGPKNVANGKIDHSYVQGYMSAGSNDKGSTVPWVGTP